MKRGLTYDQGAHEILNTVATEVEVWVCVGKLSQRYRCLLIANGAAGEVGLAEDAWGVCGVVELDALVEALCLVVILNAGPAFEVSNVCAPCCSWKSLLLDLVDEVELDTLGRHFENGGRLAVIFVEL